MSAPAIDTTIQTKRELASSRVQAVRSKQAGIQGLQRRYGNRAVGAALQTSVAKHASPATTSVAPVPASSIQPAASSSQAVSSSSSQAISSSTTAPVLQSIAPTAATEATTTERSRAAGPEPAAPIPAVDKPREETLAGRLLRVGVATLLEELGPLGAQLASVLNRSGEVMGRVVADPAGFFVNLATAVGRGFSRFADHAAENLQQGLFGWLLGAVGQQITLPKKWDAAGTFQFAAELLGLTYANIRRHLVEASSEELVKNIESGLDKMMAVGRLVQRLMMGDWQALQAEIEEHATEIKEKAMEAIRGELIVELAKKGIETLILSLNPAGLLGKGLRAAYDVVRFLMANLEKLVQVGAGVLDSVDRISRGNLDPAAATIEESLKRAVPLVLDLLARLLHLNIADKIRSAIERVRAPVEQLLAKLARALVEQVRKLIGAVVSKAKGAVEKAREWWRARVAVRTQDGASHHLEFSGSGPDATLVVASNPEEYGKYLDRSRSAVDALTGVKRDQALKAIADARAIWRQIVAKKKTLRAAQTTDAIAEDLNRLASQTEIIAGLLAGTGTVPPSVITYEGVTPRGGGKRAMGSILTRNHPDGSAPQDAAELWLRVQRRNVAGQTIWVQGHLLNHNVGGIGRKINLTPLTGTGSKYFGVAINANSAHLNVVEKYVKDEVKKPGVVLRYEVTAIYGGHPERLGTKDVRMALTRKLRAEDRAGLTKELELRLYEEANVAKALEVDAYPLVGDGGQWKTDPKGKRIQATVPNPLPDDAGQKEKLPNSDVLPRTRSLIGATPNEKE